MTDARLNQCQHPLWRLQSQEPTARPLGGHDQAPSQARCPLSLSFWVLQLGVFLGVGGRVLLLDCLKRSCWARFPVGTALGLGFWMVFLASGLALLVCNGGLVLFWPSLVTCVLEQSWTLHTGVK